MLECIWVPRNENITTPFDELPSEDELLDFNNDDQSFSTFYFDIIFTTRLHYSFTVVQVKKFSQPSSTSLSSCPSNEVR